MYKLLYPRRDASIHELHPYRNSGVDQIIDITKYAIGETYDDVIDPLASWGKNYNSRILLQFDIDDIKADINANIIDSGSAKYYLKLYAAEATALQTEYTLYAYPLAESWVNGNGNYNDEPEIRNGVSWAYRLKYESGSWSSANGTVEYATNSGGGSWNQNYAASQSFAFQSPDVYMDVTKIVKEWISGSISNNGFIIKHSSEAENNDQIYGSLKFFSKETHTIYIPTLLVLWDSDNNYTGSYTNKTEVVENYNIYCKNLKSKYNVNEKVKLRFGVRDNFVTKTYTNISEGVTERKLPETTYFSIKDYITDIQLVPFDNVATKLQMDDKGYFITLDTENLLPIRYYKIILKVVDDDGTENIIDNNFTFRVER